MNKPVNIRSMLLPGKRIAAGRAAEAAALLLASPRLTAQTVECLWDEDPGVANRAADALERASGRNPKLLAPWKEALLGRMVDAKENKLRWNLALIISRLDLTIAETDRAAALLRFWLDDQSSIVKTSAMHGLAGLALINSALLPEVLDMLRILARSGTPAMRARGRILLKRLETGKALPRITGSLPKSFRRLTQNPRQNHAGATLRLIH
jgi:hypothetical protein